MSRSKRFGTTEEIEALKRALDDPEAQRKIELVFGGLKTRVIDELRSHGIAYAKIDGMMGIPCAMSRLAAAEEEKTVREQILAGVGPRASSLSDVRSAIAALERETPAFEEPPPQQPRKSRTQQRRLPMWQRDRR